MTLPASPAVMTDTLPVLLSDLAEGAVARFHAAQLDAEACHQLRSLGLTASCELRLCQKGEPCIVQVRSTRIGLSRAVAQQILVVPLAADPLPAGHS